MGISIYTMVRIHEYSEILVPQWFDPWIVEPALRGVAIPSEGLQARQRSVRETLELRIFAPLDLQLDGFVSPASADRILWGSK